MTLLSSIPQQIGSGACILLLLLGFASCQPNISQEKRQVKVLGYGSVTTYPDYAEISVEASFTKDRMKVAVQEVQSVTNEVMTLAKRYTKAPEDVRVSSISANKAYDYVNGREKFLGYNSSQSVTIKISDLKQLEAFMEELLKTRINSIQRLQYSHTKADSLRREASALALADATKAADQLCKATNVTRGEVLEISNYQNLENSNQGQLAEQNVNVGLYGKGFGGDGFKITPELLRFKGTCHVTFALE
ncbi:SIMPL domain-containing protein [Rufibacter immobilis]|uniref:SIMPL domain-containing protein n=1 Tax=Rufibacter immobilis TaxID=1348778 RepID=UPI0035E5A749